MTIETVSTIIGFVLFALSEILPLINIPANGLIHSLILGVGNAFKSPEQDIEMAHSILTTQPNLASIVNILSTNPQIKGIVNQLVQKPETANNISSVQTNPDVSNLISLVTNNPQTKMVITKLVSDSNNIAFLSNPEVLNVVKYLGPNVVSVIPTLSENPNLLDAFKIPEVMTNISQLIQNPQLSFILNKIFEDPNLLSTITNLIPETQHV